MMGSSYSGTIYTVNEALRSLPPFSQRVFANFVYAGTAFAIYKFSSLFILKILLQPIFFSRHPGMKSDRSFDLSQFGGKKWKAGISMLLSGVGQVPGGAHF